MIGRRTVDLPEPPAPAAGQTFGNLRLVESVDLDRLHGVAAVLAQFPNAGEPWIVECVGCGSRSVTTARWARQGWTQCENYVPQCREHLARRPYASSDDAEATFAPAQSAEWSRQYERRDLRRELVGMRARVSGVLKGVRGAD